MTTAPLILASASPRRQQLLRLAGIAADAFPSSVIEQQRADEQPLSFALRIARDKAVEIATLRGGAGDHRPVLAADTIVVVDQQVLGKPADRDTARIMLRTLSGRDHVVITATCLIIGDRVEQRTTETTVTFQPLAEPEIERYLDCADWGDKAGAYAVQEHAAYMVRRIEGSYTNVVGLPLSETIELLHETGVL